MKIRSVSPTLAFILLLSVTWLPAQEAVPAPPVAKKVPKITHFNGDTLLDDYFWLREKGNPEVLAYLKAEDEYADAVMRPTVELRETLYREMVGRIKETDMEVPYRQGKYYYYSRTEEGMQYPVHCRKKGSLNGKEEVLLDLNAMAGDLPFFDIGDTAVSPDGRRLAYTTDTSGFRQYVLNVKDLASGNVVGNIAERVTGVAWAGDNRTLFYTQEDPVTKRSYRWYRVRPEEGRHELLFEETDALYNVWVGRSRSGTYIFFSSSSGTTTEWRCIRADRPGDAPRVLLRRRDGHEYDIEHAGGSFFIRTNDKGINFRLVAAPVETPDPEHWTEIIPHRPAVMLEGVDCFKDHFVVLEREGGVPAIRVFRAKGGAPRRIEFPEPVFMVHPLQNREFDARAYRFNYESLVTPSSVYDYDTRTGRRTLLKREEVLGGFDPKRYASERFWAMAEDGTRIPISIVYKKDLVRDGSRPMLLQGYGAYGIPASPRFDSARLSLLDRGFVCGIAHVRGGGDLGKAWHDGGKLMAKRNTFTDFIACAEFLVRERITAPNHLIIEGASAGGLLTGAVANLRPDLFRAVVSYVPFVDVMNTMLDATLPLTVEEYLEWGDPRDPAAYAYMKSYSPYDNIGAGAYPAMLVRSSLNDSQVMYWEPAKYVAKLRALKTDANPLLFKIRIDPGGHGGASGRYDRLREEAFDLAFILTQAGIRR